MEREVVRTVALNLLPPSGTKVTILEAARKTCSMALADLSFVAAWSPGVKSQFDLQERAYKWVREKHRIHAQVALDLQKTAWANHSTARRFRKVPIPANVPRSGRLKETRRGNPILFLHANGKRVGLPVAMDGAWTRFQALLGEGYAYTAFSVTRRGDQWVALFPLHKTFEVTLGPNCLGVDIGASTLAAVTVLDSSGKVRRQLYFGQDLRGIQAGAERRRSGLRAMADKGSHRARKALRRLRRRQRDSIRTRCWQVAHQVVKLAKEQDASVAIEDLHLPKQGPWRRANRAKNRIPYLSFRTAIESVATRNGVAVVAVKAAGTSKNCGRCGGEGLREGRRFECRCGYKANADRNASRNIAAKLLPVRARSMLRRTKPAQTTGGGGRLMAPVRLDAATVNPR